MPLNTQIIRNGEPLALRWGWWHVQVMLETAELEGVDLRKKGSHTVKEAITWEDPADGEVLPLLPGDVLTMYR